MAETIGDLKDVIERIVPHAEQEDHYGDFLEPKRGPTLQGNSPSDIRQHIYNILNDPDTKGFTATNDGQKMYFYHEKTNTVLIIDPNAPGGGSVYRPKTPSQGQSHFNKQVENCMKDRADGNNTLRLSEKPNIVTGGLEGVKTEWHALQTKLLHNAPHVLSEAGKISKNPLFDVGIGVAAGTLAYAQGASASGIAQATAGPLNPAPETTDAIIQGKSGTDIAKAAAIDTSALAGCAGGAIAGAKTLGAGGATIGTFVEPVGGTAIGGGIGGVVGGVGGCIVGAWAASGITEDIIAFFSSEETDTIPLAEIKALLPEKATTDMPPEIQALIEARTSDALLERSLQEMKNDGSFELVAAELKHQKTIQEAQTMQAANEENYITTPTQAQGNTRPTSMMS